MADIRVFQIQEKINKLKNLGVHVGSLSDTYHSFDDLYKHRMYLNAALFRTLPLTWKSKFHHPSSDKMFDGMFIVGVITPDGMATYHYDLPYWDLFKVPELPHSPEYDGHTPDEAINRINKYFNRTTLQYTPEEAEKANKYLDQVLSCFDNDDQRAAYLSTFKIIFIDDLKNE